MRPCSHSKEGTDLNVQTHFSRLAETPGFHFFDELCLQIAFILAYLIRQHDVLPYNNSLYTAIGILLAIIDFLVAVSADSMHNVVKRGYWKEFTSTVKHCTLVFLLMTLWMFSLKNADSYSRIVLFLTWLFHMAIGYCNRLLWKELTASRRT